MPTRYLKPGIRDSALIDSLSPMAETLFVRLLVTVDDFGRTDARPSMIKAACYPIKSSVKAEDCDRLLCELHQRGAVHVYAVDGKPYLQMAKWDNVPRSKHPKFPAYADGCAQVYASANEPVSSQIHTRIQMQTDAPVTVTETGTETGTGTETRGVSKKPKRFDPAAIELPDWLDRDAWVMWVKDRSKRGKPVTEKAAELQVAQLAEYLGQGHLPEAVIAHSIAGGFQGLYPKRGQAVAGSAPLQSFEERADAAARGKVDRLIHGTSDTRQPDVFDLDPAGLLGAPS